MTATWRLTTFLGRYRASVWFFPGLLVVLSLVIVLVVVVVAILSSIVALTEVAPSTTVADILDRAVDGRPRRLLSTATVDRYRRGRSSWRWVLCVSDPTLRRAWIDDIRVVWLMRELTQG